MSNTIKNSLLNFAKQLTTEEQTAFSIILQNLATNPSVELGETPLQEIFDQDERAYVTNYLQHRMTYKLNTMQLVIILKATRLCNLRCIYCNAWKSGPNQIMKFPMLAKTIIDTLTTGAQHIEFVWHGGEITLLPIKYLQKAIWLQQNFKQKGQYVSNAIQTNGTLLTEEWLQFIKDYSIGVGVSLDGPAEINDSRRLDKAGRPTAHKINEGIQALITHKINFGILMVIDEQIIKFGAKNLLKYFAATQIKVFALLNAIPKNTEDNSINGVYLPWHAYVEFMKELFLEWWQSYKSKFEIREINVLLNKIKESDASGLCYFAGNCMGKYLTIEPNGEVSACDKYIGDKDYVFGSLASNTLNEILTQSNNLRAAKAVQLANMQQLKNDCHWYNICHGSCPHDFRLNQKFQNNFTAHCCGLSPLLDTMHKALIKQKPASASSNFNCL